MNMKMEETDQTDFEKEQNNRYKRDKYSDIDEPEIDVKLPSGALKGLKDASLDPVDRMDTDMMNKHLEKSLNLVKKEKGSNDGGELIMDSKKRAKKGKAPGKKEKDLPIDKLNQPSITNISQSSSILALLNKLQEVISPSSSKPEDDDYDPEIDEDGLHMDESMSDGNSNVSIPMAHREYEKILRQLEAECRTHIKCEQQMKLHIECL